MTQTAVDGEDVIDPPLGKESKSEDLKTECGEEMPAKRRKSLIMCMFFFSSLNYDTNCILSTSHPGM